MTDIDYHMPCTICGYYPDGETGDPPNVHSNEGPVTLCETCIENFHRTLTQWYDDHPTPRALYGSSITYRERC